MKIRESHSERLADEWREEEGTIVYGGIALFTMIAGAASLALLIQANGNWRDEVFFSCVTFAVPCWAAVIGGVGLYHDHRGSNTVSRKCFVASYLALLLVMLYFVLAHARIPPITGGIVALVMIAFSFFANVLLVRLRKKEASLSSRWLLAFHVIAFVATGLHLFTGG